MFEKTLLERIQAADGSERRGLKLDLSLLSDSILQNLRTIFNARQGSTETRPDLGMPDFNDLALQFPDAIPVIGRAIKHQIDNFEPRLKNISVRYLPDPANPLSLVFQISAQIAVGDDDETFTFDTILGDDGHCRLRR